MDDRSWVAVLVFILTFVILLRSHDKKFLFQKSKIKKDELKKTILEVKQFGWITLLSIIITLVLVFIFDHTIFD